MRTIALTFNLYSRKFSHRLLARSSAGALAPALGVTCTALAQEEPGQYQARATLLEEVVVTAQKRTQAINEVPMSISAYSSSELEKAGIMDVGDLAKITPGFTYGQSNLGTPVYTIRGVGYNDVAIATRPAVTVYLDEAPMPFAIETQGVGLDIERVEVLKGPQGTLFGANSTGGAINYIARKPTHEFEAGGIATYGRFDQTDISAYVSGPLTDTLSARLAAEYRGKGDWQDNYTRSGSLGNKDFKNGRFALLWEPSDALRAQLTVNGWTDKSDTQATQLSQIIPQVPGLVGITGLEDYPLAPHDDRAADWDQGRKLERNNDYFQSTLRLDYEVNDNLTFTSLTNYLKLNVDFLVDADGTSIVDVSANSQDGYSKTLSQELRLEGDVDRLNVLGGLAYSQDKTHDHLVSYVSGSTLAYTASPVLDGIGSFTNQKVDNYAVFGNVEYMITDELTLQGGARYTDSRNDGSTCLGADTGDGVLAAALNNILNFGFRAPGGLPPVPAVMPGECAAINTATLQHQTMLLDQNLDEDNVSWRAYAWGRNVFDTYYWSGAAKLIDTANRWTGMPATYGVTVAYDWN